MRLPSAVAMEAEKTMISPSSSSAAADQISQGSSSRGWPTGCSRRLTARLVTGPAASGAERENRPERLSASFMRGGLRADAAPHR